MAAEGVKEDNINMSLKLIILMISLIVLWLIVKDIQHKWRQKPPKCVICDYKIDVHAKFGQGQSWYCTKMSIPGKEPGKAYCKSICGIPRVKTSPIWCPKRKRK